ncbi:DUF4956 domain-containing protein [bacterium]|nr:DUF4956 domain-containing protein [bacterium]
MERFLDDVLRHPAGIGVLTVESIVLCLLTTFLLSHVVAWLYVATHRGVSYSGTMARSMIALSLIVATVMMVIGNNIVSAFGLFGALALIRFRTPVKDANDTVFLFLAVAIGIATGTGNFLVAVLGTAGICLAYFYLSGIRFGERLGSDGLLRFHLPVGAKEDSAIRRVLDRYCVAFTLLHLREAEPGATVEFSYQIKMVDTRSGPGLVGEMEGLPGVQHLSLLMQDSEASP